MFGWLEAVEEVLEDALEGFEDALVEVEEALIEVEEAAELPVELVEAVLSLAPGPTVGCRDIAETVQEQLARISLKLVNI